VRHGSLDQFKHSHAKNANTSNLQGCDATMVVNETDVHDSSYGVETALATLQPIRDLAKNWDIDVASW
jgi:hypothetical protein